MPPRGYHYRPFIERFNEKIEMIAECGCWIWTGAVQGDGYGVIKNEQNIQKSAHRISWEFYYGPIPEGLKVLHQCDTPSCVNPHHLFTGTNKDNTQDMIRKNRKFLTKGELQKSSKLKSSDVVSIRESIKLGELECSLATKFNVSQSTISLIKHRKIWTHI
jgi:hypothetical protein